MSGVGEKVHYPAKHDFVPIEKSFRVSREDPVAVSIGRRCRGSEATATLEEVFGVREITIRTWLCRSGVEGKKLHERFMVELELVHVQFDEMWADIKGGGRCVVINRQRCEYKAGAGGA